MTIQDRIDEIINSIENLILLHLDGEEQETVLGMVEELGFQWQQANAHARAMTVCAAVMAGEKFDPERTTEEELNLEQIRINLAEMDEACSNIRWYLGREVDELEELLGEDDAIEFKASFGALADDIERIQEETGDIWVPDYFDDFMAAVHPDGRGILGYDSWEEDYFPLSTFQTEAACREAAERLQRKTKRELIDCAHIVMGIVCQYMAVKYRFDSLSAAFDVLMERSEQQLRAVREIEEAWAAAEADDFNDWKESTRRLDRLLRSLPDRIWTE